MGLTPPAQDPPPQSLQPQRPDIVITSGGDNATQCKEWRRASLPPAPAGDASRQSIVDQAQTRILVNGNDTRHTADARQTLISLQQPRSGSMQLLANI